MIREPRNPYDRNAIQVKNINNVQVGHIQRNDAFLLSPLMDTLSTFRMEVTIPRGSNNVYSIPLDINFFGSSQVCAQCAI